MLMGMLLPSVQMIPFEYLLHFILYLILQNSCPYSFESIQFSCLENDINSLAKGPYGMYALNVYKPMV